MDTYKTSYCKHINMVPRNVFDEEDDEEDEDEDENENKQNTQQEQKHPRTHYCSHVRLTKENTFPFDPGLGASAGEHEGCEIPTPLHWRFAKAWHRSGSHDSWEKEAMGWPRSKRIQLFWGV